VVNRGRGRDWKVIGSDTSSVGAMENNYLPESTDPAELTPSIRCVLSKQATAARGPERKIFEIFLVFYDVDVHSLLSWQE
jgi:hypothetical protein